MHGPGPTLKRIVPIFATFTLNLQSCLRGLTKLAIGNGLVSRIGPTKSDCQHTMGNSVVVHGKTHAPCRVYMEHRKLACRHALHSSMARHTMLRKRSCQRALGISFTEHIKLGKTGCCHTVGNDMAEHTTLGKPGSM